MATLVLLTLQLCPGACVGNGWFARCFKRTQRAENSPGGRYSNCNMGVSSAPQIRSLDASPDRELLRILPGSPDLRGVSHPAFGNWLAYRSTLRPRYGQVWMDILLCLTAILGGYAADFLLTQRFGNLAEFLLLPLFAVWLGFWLNALLTFGHEGAHYNLSSSRFRNDLLADWSIWLFFPQSSKSYRRSHWQHHLHLGDPQDTEISYHNCMSPWFMVKALTGVYLLELLARYAMGKRTTPQIREVGTSASPAARLGQMAAVARAGTTHLFLIGLPLYFHCYATAAAWLLGAALIFPFLATTRQLLEHRSEDAHCATDYVREHHGPVNRMFAKNMFSRYFGAAGFNRHLLHHWDPTVSYTCFDDMEKFFDGTQLHQQLEKSRTTYTSSLLVLMRKALRDLS